MVADQIGAGPRAVVEGELDPAGTLHDVAVGEREAVGGEHDPRATRRHARPPLCPARLQVPYGGRHRFGGRDDGAGIGIEELGLAPTTLPRARSRPLWSASVLPNASWKSAS
jgi:hypothetical protein